MRTTVPGIRTLVLIFFFFLFSGPSFSQSFSTGNGVYEAGLGVGPMLFLGDLGGTKGKGKTFLKDVNLPATNLSFGAYVNLYPTEFLGFRLAINKGKLEGFDSLVKDQGGSESSRKLRNLSFQSHLWEAYIAGEFYPTVFFEKYDGVAGKLRPYGLMGIGLFHFNPKGQYIANNGERTWVELQPLRLEGQGMAEYPDRKLYKRTAVEIPMGFGAKYYISDNKYIGLEVLHRKTFTDYIDDVSTNYIDANLFNKYLNPEQAKMARQLHYRENLAFPQSRGNTPSRNEQRGDPKEKDSFFSAVLRFGWRLNDPDSPLSRAMRQMRCPSFY